MVFRVVVKHAVDVLRRCGESFVRAPKKASVHGFWIHVDYLAGRGPESIVLTVAGRELEIVDIDDQQRASNFMPIDALPFFGERGEACGFELLFAVCFPEAICIGMTIEGQYQSHRWSVECPFPFRGPAVLGQGDNGKTSGTVPTAEPIERLYDPSRKVMVVS